MNILKIVLIASLGLFYTHFEGSAQDWNLFNQNDTAYYEITWGKLAAIHFLDSSEIRNVRSFKMNKHVTLNDTISDYPVCYRIGEGSVFGSEWRIINNGIQQIVNTMGDTLKFKTRLSTDTFWTILGRKNRVYIAKLIEEAESDILGIVDSIKSFEIQVFDKDQNRLKSEVYDGEILKLSKNYGLLNTFHWNTFPNRRHHVFDHRFLVDIAGHSALPEGYSHFGWREIYELYPGDEIHLACNQFSAESSKSNKIIHEYVDRKDSGNTIYLKWKVKERYNEDDHQSDKKRIGYREYERYEEYKPNYILDNLPYYPNTDEGLSRIDPVTAFYKPDFYGMEFMGKKDTRRLVSFSYPTRNDSCSYYSSYGHCDTRYYRGLGGPYKSCRTLYIEIVGFVKNGKEYGTLYRNLSSEVKDYSFNIFPNPADRLIFIDFDFPGNKEITLMNTSGQTVKSQETDKNNYQIDVSDQPPGVYILIVETDSKGIERKKVVIQ